MLTCLYVCACVVSLPTQNRYWSKDFGKTWTSSAPVAGLGECSITFLVSPADGNILMNCRTNAQEGRAQLVWSADGIPGKVTHPKGLIDPGCQGNVIDSVRFYIVCVDWYTILPI